VSGDQTDSLRKAKAAWHAARSRELAGTKEYTRAESEARKAIRLDSGVADHHNLLGNALWIQQRYGLAEVAYRAAATLDEREGNIWANLAATVLRQGRTDEARELGRKAKALGSEHWVLDELEIE
jgi:Flp pilus assembly protein TadD